MGRLDGKIALVTGGSRGIGRAICIELARAGARVALSFRARQVEAGAVAAQIADMGGEAWVAQADISSSVAARTLVKQVIEHFGVLDILVNNAGIAIDRALEDYTDADWEAVIDTNLNGTYFTVSAAIPSMREHRYGRIINISGHVGHPGNFGHANYAASAGGIIAFTKSAALELARHNITVNAVVPGFTETDMLTDMSGVTPQTLATRIPMGRLGKPEDVATAVRFLAAEGDYITGQQLNVNGGLFM